MKGKSGRHGKREENVLKNQLKKGVGKFDSKKGVTPKTPG